MRYLDLIVEQDRHYDILSRELEQELSIILEYRYRGFNDSLGDKMANKIEKMSLKFFNLARDKKKAADELNDRAADIKLKFGSRVFKYVDDLLRMAQESPIIASIILALFSFLYSTSLGLSLLIVPLLSYWAKRLKKKHGVL